MQQWEREQKERILAKHPVCWLCDIRPSVQLHHVFVHDMKRYHRELTVPENLMPVCAECHTSLDQGANGMMVKYEFAAVQILEGYKIASWYRGLSLKVKNEKWILELEE